MHPDTGLALEIQWRTRQTNVLNIAAYVVVGKDRSYTKRKVNWILSNSSNCYLKIRWSNEIHNTGGSDQFKYIDQWCSLRVGENWAGTWMLKKSPSCKSLGEDLPRLRKQQVYRPKSVHELSMFKRKGPVWLEQNEERLKGEKKMES